MKVKLLSAYSCKDGSYGVGEKIDVDELVGYRMVEAGLAEPADANAKKALAKVKERLEKEAKEAELAKARLEKERLEKELQALYEQVVELEAKVAGVALDEATKSKLVEEIASRETRVGAK